MSLCLMTPSLISIAFVLDFSPDVFLGTAAPLSLLALVCVLESFKLYFDIFIFFIIDSFSYF